MKILVSASPFSEIIVGPVTEPAGEDTANLEVTIGFADGSRLVMFLLVNVSSDYPLWRHYSFHYMTSENECIFRYDNSWHHLGLPFTPHHKHEGPEEEVTACRQPSIHRIRNEIEAYLKAKG